MANRRVLVLYSKPGCCLCEQLEAKLRPLEKPLGFTLAVRDITSDPDWFADFQYTIPVLEYAGRTLAGISHRTASEDLAAVLRGAFFTPS